MKTQSKNRLLVPLHSCTSILSLPLRYVSISHSPAQLFIALDRTGINITRRLDKVRNQKLFFLFLNKNICCGYSKNRLNDTVLLSTQTYVIADE